jgi:hypothetical protein
VNFTTTIRVSNRKAHYTAGAFLHPDRTGVYFDFAGSADLTAAGMAFAQSFGAFAGSLGGIAGQMGAAALGQTAGMGQQAIAGAAGMGADGAGVGQLGRDAAGLAGLGSDVNSMLRDLARGSEGGPV